MSIMRKQRLPRERSWATARSHLPALDDCPRPCRSEAQCLVFACTKGIPEAVGDIEQ